MEWFKFYWFLIIIAQGICLLLRGMEWADGLSNALPISLLVSLMGMEWADGLSLLQWQNSETMFAAQNPLKYGLPTILPLSLIKFSSVIAQALLTYRIPIATLPGPQLFSQRTEALQPNNRKLLSISQDLELLAQQTRDLQPNNWKTLTVSGKPQFSCQRTGELQLLYDRAVLIKDRADQSSLIENLNQEIKNLNYKKGDFL